MKENKLLTEQEVEKVKYAITDNLIIYLTDLLDRTLRDDLSVTPNGLALHKCVCDALVDVLDSDSFTPVYNYVVDQLYERIQYSLVDCGVFSESALDKIKKDAGLDDDFDAKTTIKIRRHENEELAKLILGAPKGGIQ